MIFSKLTTDRPIMIAETRNRYGICMLYQSGDIFDGVIR
jgi:hypothetical protein